MLQTVGGQIRISDNTSLPTCKALEFVDSVANKGGAPLVYDNKLDTCD